MTHWVLAPELALRSAGNVRFVGGLALGLEGQATDASVLNPGPTIKTEISGAGTSAMGLLEAGLEGGAKRLYFQGLLFVDIHGIGALDGHAQRLYLDSPAVRAGARFNVVFPF